MEVLNKCKMCGGTLVPQADGVTGKCEYCDSVLPLPRVKDYKLQNILNRANDFRIANDFDRAIKEYEDAIRIDETEPEIHWGIFLSRYGVEYVKDPYTFTYKPTIHRISSASVFDDPDYKATIKYSDQTNIIKYKQLAEEIEAVMKEFFAISSQQKQYDVFICYKEADDITRSRTDDSFIAHDLYAELTSNGYKTFFAPKSLVGGLFEPKIYAAITSAKVMIVLGTNPRYFNAIWVKNEWSRFVELIENGERKMIVPVYKNMKAEDLPNKLAKYQAYDMSNMSFLPSILKIISKYSDNNSLVSFDNTVSGEAAILERGFLELKDKNFSSADSYFEKVLNINPHNPEAYFGKLMVEMKVTQQNQILASSKYLNEYSNFERAVRFANYQLKSTLLKYEKAVSDTINEQKYNALLNNLSEIKESDSLEPISEEFKKLGNYKNANQYVKTIEEIENERISLQKMKEKKKFDFVEIGLFRFLGGIAGFVIMIIALVDEGLDTGVLNFLGIIIMGIVCIIAGIVAGFILDCTLLNLIFYIIHKITTPHDLSDKIKESQNKIKTLFASLKESADIS